MAVLEDLIDCYTWSQIQDRHGVSNRYIQKVAKLLPPHRSRSDAVKAERAKRIARMLKTMTQSDVSARLGIDQTTVSKYALLAGFSSEDARKKAIIERRKSVKAMLGRGDSVKEIAEQIGCSASTIYSDIREISNAQ